MLEFKRPHPVPDNLQPRWNVGVDRRHVFAYVGVALLGGFVLGFAVAKNLSKPEAKPGPPLEALKTNQSVSPSNQSESAEYHRVNRILRGDTMEVEGVGAVRMIGVETPDGKQPRESYAIHGQNALSFVQKTLLGQDVRLEFDEANARRNNKDEAGQTLAYVYTRDGKQINSELLRLGLALVRGSEQFGVSNDFRMIEREALQNSRGVWGPSAPALASAAASTTTSTSISEDRSKKLAPLAPSSIGENIPALTKEPSYSAESFVFVSPADQMYHKTGCELLDTKKKHPMPISQARSEGYTACSRCYASTVLKAP